MINYRTHGIWFLLILAGYFALQDETIRELRQQLQKWKDEEGQRFSRLMHTEVNQQADK